MDWLAFSYSLSSKSSSPPVSIWRQLKRVGAVSPVGGVHILPAQEPCIEAFGWLAQQVRQAGGEAVVMHVGQFEGLTDQEAIVLLRQARQEEYEEINPDAAIRYASEPQAHEVPFDMPDAEFSHQGRLCTFEVMLRTFGLEQAALHTLAEIVHEIDLRDGVYAHPEMSGVDALLRGWQLAGMPDEAIEACGQDLFDGLYTVLAGRLPATG
jgi:hypothetical protein